MSLAVTLLDSHRRDAIAHAEHCEVEVVWRDGVGNLRLDFVARATRDGVAHAALLLVDGRPWHAVWLEDGRRVQRGRNDCALEIVVDAPYWTRTDERADELRELAASALTSPHELGGRACSDRTEDRP